MRDTAKRVILSRVDNLIALQSNASSQSLKTAQSKYNDKCKDMKLAVERLVCIDPAYSHKYLKVLEDIGKEREELGQRVTEAYKYRVNHK